MTRRPRAAAASAADDRVSTWIARAQSLDARGADDAAREAYLAVLARDAGNVAALNGLGLLLNRTGHARAAHATLARAVALHPDDVTSQGNFASALFDAGDIDAARQHYSLVLQLDPNNVPANQCLAVLFLRLGDEAAAQRHAAIGFRAGASAWPYRGTKPPIPVLVLYSALGGNVATDVYIDDRTFAKWTLVAEFCDPALPLPQHALVVNAIGDADRCGVALRAAAALLAGSRVPLINAPAQVLATQRSTNARRLADVPGVRMPRAIECRRADLLRADAAAQLAARGLSCPLILRAPGFHTGQHCTRVQQPDDLAPAAAQLPGDAVLAIEYVDVRRADGAFPKYRVMIVDGALYPLHLALSNEWKVHYFRADMSERPDHRAEEAAFLNDLPGVLGATALAALHTVAQELGLDYAGIDFALDRAGRVVVFEANATMIVPPPPADARWDYRRAAVDRIHRAVRTMLLGRTVHHQRRQR